MSVPSKEGGKLWEVMIAAQKRASLQSGRHGEELVVFLAFKSVEGCQPGSERVSVSDESRPIQGVVAKLLM